VVVETGVFLFLTLLVFYLLLTRVYLYAQKQKNMEISKGEFYKKLENLKSWKTFALSGVVQNVPEANKIDLQIIELKDRYNHYL
jgi:uncharacterized protein YaiE (UPF0345 family)